MQASIKRFIEDTFSTEEDTSLYTEEDSSLPDEGEETVSSEEDRSPRKRATASRSASRSLRKRDAVSGLLSRSQMEPGPSSGSFQPNSPRWSSKVLERATPAPRNQEIIDKNPLLNAMVGDSMNSNRPFIIFEKMVQNANSSKTLAAKRVERVLLKQLCRGSTERRKRIYKVVQEKIEKFYPTKTEDFRTRITYIIHTALWRLGLDSHRLQDKEFIFDIFVRTAVRIRKAVNRGQEDDSWAQDLKVIVAPLLQERDAGSSSRLQDSGAIFQQQLQEFGAALRQHGFGASSQKQPFSTLFEYYLQIVRVFYESQLEQIKYSLEPQQESDSPLQQQDAGSSLQQQESGASLQQQESGASLQQQESGTSLQQQESGTSLQQQESGASLQQQESGTSLQQQRQIDQGNRRRRKSSSHEREKSSGKKRRE